MLIEKSTQAKLIIFCIKISCKYDIIIVVVIIKSFINKILKNVDHFVQVGDK